MVLACDRQADASSRIKPRLAPRAPWVIALELHAIMETEWPLLPELDGNWHNPIAGPVGRPRNVTDGVFRGIYGHRLLERESAFQRGRLLAGPGADLGLLGSGGEVGSRLVLGDVITGPAHTPLPVHRLPVEDKRGQRLCV